MLDFNSCNGLDAKVGLVKLENGLDNLPFIHHDAHHANSENKNDHPRLVQPEKWINRGRESSKQTSWNLWT